MSEELAMCTNINCLSIVPLSQLNEGRCPHCLSDVEELEDDLFECPECGEPAEEMELDSHGGVCKVCYDDNHFGDEPPYDDEDE